MTFKEGRATILFSSSVYVKRITACFIHNFKRQSVLAFVIWRNKQVNHDTLKSNESNELINNSDKNNLPANLWVQ